MISTAIILVFLVFTLHQESISADINKESLSLKKRADITPDQIQCISKYLSDEIESDSNCLAVVVQLQNLYESSAPVTDISSRVRFSEFCLPSCGQLIIDAWQSCNAYSEVEDFANLLIRMCASHMDTVCYTYGDEFFRYFYDGVNCYMSLESTGQCSSECASGTRNGVESYGCCVNIAIRYELPNTNFTEADVNNLFSACDVSRPDSCKNSPLMEPSSASPVSIFIAAVYICLSTIVALFNG